MPPRRFTLASYMAPGDAFHIARKPLESALPAPHTHDYHELFLVEAGTCRHAVNGCEQRLETGSLVFVRPEDVHALATAGGAPCRIVNVMTLPETVAHLFRRYAEDLSGRFWDSGSAAPATLRLGPARLKRATDLMLPLLTGPRSLARIEALLLALMTDMSELPLRDAAAMPAWLAQACDAARQPEVYRRGAAGLIAVAGRGHEHVCRQMKRHLGLTPTAYVNRLRMDAAAALLAQEEQARLPEVAAAVGLENLSHFHRLFRARHGLTPRAWRELHAKAPF